MLGVILKIFLGYMLVKTKHAGKLGLICRDSFTFTNNE